MIAQKMLIKDPARFTSAVLTATQSGGFSVPLRSVFDIMRIMGTRGGKQVRLRSKLLFGKEFRKSAAPVNWTPEREKPKKVKGGVIRMLLMSSLRKRFDVSFNETGG
jgi:hypothetical protein